MVSPSSRPGNRRRDTSDSLPPNGSLASPAGNNRLSKDETQSSTPSSLLRRKTDYKESSFGLSLGDKAKEGGKQESGLDTASPFGTFKRTATTPLSANVNGPSSPWSVAPQSAGFAPMGAFGNFSLGGATVQSPTPSDKKISFGSLRGESRFKGLMSKDIPEDTPSRLKDKSSIGSLEKLTERGSERQPWVAARSARPLSTDSNPYGEAVHGSGSAALGGDDPSPQSQYALKTNKNPEEYRDDIGFASVGISSDLPPFREMMHRREYAHQQTPQAQHHASGHMNEPMSPTSTNPYQSPEGDNVAPEEFDTDGSDIQNTPHSSLGPSAHPSKPFLGAFEATPSDRSQTSSAGPSRGFLNLGSLGGTSSITSGPWSAAPGAIGTASRANAGFASGFGDSMFSSLSEVQSPGFATAGFTGPPTSAHFGNIGNFGRGSKMGSLFPTAMQDQMRGADLSKHEQGLGDMIDSHQFGTGRNQANTIAPGFGTTGRETGSPSRPGRGVLDELFGNLDTRSRGLQSINSPYGASEAQSNAFNQTSATQSSQTNFSSVTTVVGTTAIAAPSLSSSLGRIQDQDPSAAISSQIPATQQRQMVMPDRMRWIYRDPQGNTQGPWSGLEMHDWYKAGFFSPELQVKKLEDADYEPLAQLIRRIGNSREPFLVPQIGIPHGSANALPSSNVPVLGTLPATSPGVQSGSAQPPFASSFPSFGTTLTAEQQNALERRKQEEQYLMARQKEHLAQQQVMIKQMQHMQGGPHGIHAQQLHHHSSAHSLQSQPSYGSITSPSGYQPSPGQAPIQPPGTVPSFFENHPRGPGNSQAPLGLGPESLSQTRDGEIAAALERLNTGRSTQAQYASTSHSMNLQESLNQQQKIASMLQDRARLQREQEHYGLLQRGAQDDSQGTMDRLEQFHHFRALDSSQLPPSQGSLTGASIAPSVLDNENHFQQQDHDQSSILMHDQEGADLNPQREMEPLSLTEQIQKATSIQQFPMAQTQSARAKVESGLPQPFPPPQSISPLPAPAAQRSRQNVADTLAAESRSRSQTPSIETPSATLAPWARESSEGTKGPSLKEIQEVEARKTAQQEEIAVASRRAIAEQERQLQSQTSAPTQGLPSSASWASSGSPATPTSNAASAWAKPLAGKVPVATPAAGIKKTLAQIQKEEEVRKQRVAAAATAASVSNNLAGAPTLPGGKRYADLAGKVASPVGQGPGNAWTTVGAGGKLKAPPLGASPALPVQRAVSGGNGTNLTPATKPKSVVIPLRSTTLGGPMSGQQNASEEFQKWAKGALSKGLNSGINGTSGHNVTLGAEAYIQNVVDDFVRNLLQLPSEPEILSEAIYGSSQTLDGRRFAEEFIRRRKLADKGIVPEIVTSGTTGFAPTNGAESKSAGGWSEVAKKGPVNASKEEPSTNFKVVAAKKKGKR